MDNVAIVVTQYDHSNNKCYASAFIYIYIYMYIFIDYDCIYKYIL